ncbi:hypothetical protein, partial [Streptomyces sp. NPDC001833]|uniref:hypothetical protein n=1 Tax=Streptomyces sp. NPDC001833 TaxID=3154658 RepID=UPI00332B3B7D
FILDLAPVYEGDAEGEREGDQEHRDGRGQVGAREGEAAKGRRPAAPLRGAGNCAIAPHRPAA